MLGGNVVNKLLNKNGFTDTGAAEQTDFAALYIRCKQVDNFDARFHDFLGVFAFGIGWSGFINASSLGVVGKRFATVDRFTQNIEQSAKNLFTNRNGNRCAGGEHFHPAEKSLAWAKHYAPNKSVAYMLRNFHYTLFFTDVKIKLFSYPWQCAFVKGNIHNGAVNTGNFAHAFCFTGLVVQVYVPRFVTFGASF